MFQLKATRWTGKAKPAAKTTGLFLCILFSLLSIGCAMPVDESVASTSEAIVGGSVTTAFPEVVLIDMSSGKCTGTLIGPKIVLTAGHCVQGTTSFKVRYGVNYEQSQTTRSSKIFDWVTGTTMDPRYHDIAVLFLSTPISVAKYATVASSALTDAEMDSVGGQTVVGRTRDSNPSDRWVFQTPTWVFKSVAVGRGTCLIRQYPFDYNGSKFLEGGDSGGPLFRTGTHEVVAVNSGRCDNADNPANGYAYYARTDLLYDWLTAQIEASNGSTPPPSSPPPSSAHRGGLASGQQMNTGEYVTSTNEVTRLAWGPGSKSIVIASTFSFGTPWTATFSGIGTPSLIMRSDGNLVVQLTVSGIVWQSGTSGNPGAHLELQNDGNAVIYTTSGRPIWSTGTSSPCGVLPSNAFLAKGQFVKSCSNRYQFSLQSNGNFTLTNIEVGRSLGTWGLGLVNKLSMQADGNLVAFNSAGKAFWSTRTGGNSGARLAVQDDGNIVLYAADGRALWATNTSE